MNSTRPVTRLGSAALQFAARYGAPTTGERSISVYQAIIEGLDNKAAELGSPRDVRQSVRGAYTEASIPPKAYVEYTGFGGKISDARTYVDKLKSELEKNHIEGAPNLRYLDKESSEADVAALFARLVLDPVEVALAKIEMPAGYRLLFRNEAKAPDGASTVIVDTVLEVVKESTGNCTPIALLEFKNWGGVESKLKNFEACKVDEEKAKDIIRGTQSNFGPDATKLLQQCTAYASKFKTRHVALCDWSSILFIDFIKLNPDDKRLRKRGFAGFYARMHKETNPGLFHISLLAFFKYAVDEWARKKVEEQKGEETTEKGEGKKASK